MLFNKRPLVINVDLAEKIGLNAAIILQQIHYWLEKSDNVIDGKRWVYNSVKEWAKQFPFFSESTIKRTIKELEELGLIQSACHNKAGFDRTKWYTINNLVVKSLGDRLGQNDQMRLGQNDQMQEVNLSQAIPEITQRLLTRDYLKDNTSAKADNSAVVKELFNFWVAEMNKNPKTTLMTSKRCRAIKARLSEGYSLDLLKKAVLGCKKSTFHMGDNKDGKIYNDIELICRDGSKVESFSALADMPDLSQYSAVTRKNIKNLEGGW